MKIKIKDVLPNPFRNVEHYKINRKKVEQLIKSFETTSVWPVLIARKASTNGSVELAFGHHRKVAIEERYGKNHEIEVIIQPLNDEQMLKYMANENQTDFASSFVTDVETVDAVVKAFGAGKITLNKAQASGRSGISTFRFRYAPLFGFDLPIEKTNTEKAYTAQTVAEFLGWVKGTKQAQNRVCLALTALELIEEGYLKLSQLNDQNSTEACYRIIRETEQTRDDKREQLKNAQEYADQIEADYQKVKGTPQEKELSYQHKQSKRDLDLAKKKLKTEPAAAAERVAAHERNKKRKDREAKEAAREGVPLSEENLPSVEEAAVTTARMIENTLTSHDEIGRRLKELVKYRDKISPATMQYLVLVLGGVFKRSERWAKQLASGNKRLADKLEEITS
jgi:ParB-like nuclease domain